MTSYNTVTVSKHTFPATDEAKEKLQNLLESYRSAFDEEIEDDPDQIDSLMEDVEKQLSFSLRKQLDMGEVLTPELVEMIKRSVDSPDTFLSTRSPAPGEGSTHQTKYGQRHIHLYRDRENKLLGGVCSGLGAFIGVDPFWIRLAFVLSFLYWGAGLLVYGLLWLLIPIARTDEQTKRMHTGRTGNGFLKVLRGIGRLVAMFLVALITLFSILFLAGFSGLLGFASLNYDHSMSLVFASSWQLVLGLTSFTLLLFLPFSFFVIKGIQTLLGVTRSFRTLGVVFAVCWVLSLLSFGFVSVPLGLDFLEKETFKHTKTLNVEAGKPVRLVLNQPPASSNDLSRFDRARGESRLVKQILDKSTKLDLIPSTSNPFRLTTYASARGTSTSEARNRAKAIQYEVSTKDNRIGFPAYSRFGRKTPWRNQQVRSKLHVPSGTTLMVDHKLMEHMPRISFRNRLPDRSTPVKIQVTENRLTCLNCQSKEEALEQTAHDIEDFRMVNVNGPFQVRIKQGDKFRVHTEMPPSFVEQTKVVKKGETLSMYFSDEDEFPDPQEQWEQKLMQNKAYLPESLSFDLHELIRHMGPSGEISATITMPELDKYTGREASGAKISGFSGNELELILEEASRATVDLRHEKLETRLEEASSLRLTGEVGFLKADLSEMSELHALGCSSTDATLHLQEFCRASVHVTDTLDITAEEMSSLEYTGNPDVIRKDLSVSSKITRIETKDEVNTR